MIKYMTRSGYGHATIAEREVLRETQHCVFLATEYASETTKRSKRSVYENWHDTWCHAKDFLVDEAQQKINALEMQIEHERARLAHIQAMKET